MWKLHIWPESPKRPRNPSSVGSSSFSSLTSEHQQDGDEQSPLRSTNNTESTQTHQNPSSSSCWASVRPYGTIRLPSPRRPRNPSSVWSSSSSISFTSEISQNNSDLIHSDSENEESAATQESSKIFTFRELANATNNFSPECLLGQGGFGPIYKGCLPSSGQVVAVKQLDRNGLSGNREFLVEVLILSKMHHRNIINLIGYCADIDQRLLVYEFMPLGSLTDHLHDLPPDKEPLDWRTRMKIAAGAAKALEYLHNKVNPPVIHRNFKPTNILLDERFRPKLSDFVLAKLGPVGDKTHVSTRVMGTFGYFSPEYAMTGQLTLKADIYSFGVVLLELISGRKAIDNTRSEGKIHLVAWARPLFNDRTKITEMVDPLLQGKYPLTGMYQALAVAAMCLQEEAANRPLIEDVVTAVSYIASQRYQD